MAILASNATATALFRFVYVITVLFSFSQLSLSLRVPKHQPSLCPMGKSHIKKLFTSYGFICVSRKKKFQESALFLVPKFILSPTF
jgi:hypothetical protein